MKKNFLGKRRGAKRNKDKKHDKEKWRNKK